MLFSGKLYAGEKIAERANELVGCLSRSDSLKSWKKEYVMVLPLNPQNLLELIPVRELELDYYRKSELYAVGLAADKQEAKELTARIVEDVIKDRGILDLKAFFEPWCSGG